jgi:hypothetical protein
MNGIIYDRHEGIFPVKAIDDMEVICFGFAGAYFEGEGIVPPSFHIRAIDHHTGMHGGLQVPFIIGGKPFYVVMKTGEEVNEGINFTGIPDGEP